MITCRLTNADAIEVAVIQIDKDDPPDVLMELSSAVAPTFYTLEEVSVDGLQALYIEAECYIIPTAHAGSGIAGITLQAIPEPSKVVTLSDFRKPHDSDGHSD